MIFMSSYLQIFKVLAQGRAWLVSIEGARLEGKNSHFLGTPKMALAIAGGKLQGRRTRVRGRQQMHGQEVNINVDTSINVTMNINVGMNINVCIYCLLTKHLLSAASPGTGSKFLKKL